MELELELELELGKEYSQNASDTTDSVRQTRLEDTKIDGETAVRALLFPTQTGQGYFNYVYDIYIKGGSNYYNIPMVSGTEENFKKYQPVFEQMVTSFKFL